MLSQLAELPFRLVGLLLLSLQLPRLYIMKELHAPGLEIVVTVQSG